MIQYKRLILGDTDFVILYIDIYLHTLMIPCPDINCECCTKFEERS